MQYCQNLRIASSGTRNGWCIMSQSSVPMPSRNTFSEFLYINNPLPPYIQIDLTSNPIDLPQDFTVNDLVSPDLIEKVKGKAATIWMRNRAEIKLF